MRSKKTCWAGMHHANVGSQRLPFLSIASALARLLRYVSWLRVPCQVCSQRLGAAVGDIYKLQIATINLIFSVNMKF